MSNPAEMMPFAKTMGVQVSEASAERVVGTLLVRDDLCTVGGILHGGAIMAFADSLGAIGGFLSLPEGATGTTTLESKTNFLGSAKAGVTVRGETTPVHRGKRTSVWQTKITTDDGKSVALVLQTQMTLFRD
ncbi:MAG: PaaI family thioesterase [Caulobacterales bacterium]|jgi:uncharacterized protein (TIGR00369 family)|nr:PaaI family thioesterase [Caulobacterales bacterium]